MCGFNLYIKALASELDHSNFGFLVTYVTFFMEFPEFEIPEVCSNKVRTRCITQGTKS